jgi:hypothetical protein
MRSVPARRAIRGHENTVTGEYFTFGRPLGVSFSPVTSSSHPVWGGTGRNSGLERTRLRHGDHDRTAQLCTPRNRRLHWSVVVEICHHFVCPFRPEGGLSRTDDDSSTAKGGGSIGRAAVSKTAGCRFKSCPPCSSIRAPARVGSFDEGSS